MQSLFHCACNSFRDPEHTFKVIQRERWWPRQSWLVHVLQGAKMEFSAKHTSGQHDTLAGQCCMGRLFLDVGSKSHLQRKQTALSLRIQPEKDCTVM